MGKRLGLDPQFLQAILAHKSVTMTLDRYAEVELEDVKREFAKLDLSNGHMAPAEPTEAELIERLKKQSPPGKEPAWNMILDGLVALLEEGAAMTRGEVQSRVRYATKMVVLTIPGEPQPEVYLVASEVFGILGRCSQRTICPFHSVMVRDSSMTRYGSF